MMFEELPYDLGETLGEGATGKVKLGIHRVTGEKVAVKIVEKTLFRSDDPTEQEHLRLLCEKIDRECDIQKQFDHPHVLKFLKKYETRSQIFLVLEYVDGGEMFDYLVKNGRLKPEEARRVFTQLISAVDYCHQHNVCHRDIKPENVLLTKEKNLKVCDFGYAQYMHAASNGIRGYVETSCGSPHYASPEVIMGDPYKGFMADVWSCGVVLYALLTGGLPFDDESVPRLLSKVKRGQFVIPAWVTPDAQDLIKRCLCVNPDKRIIIDQIVKHPWFTGGVAPSAGTSSMGGGGGTIAGRFHLSSVAEEPMAGAAMAGADPDFKWRRVDSYLQKSMSRQQLAEARHNLLELKQERRQRANRAGTRTASESNLAAGGAEPSAASEIARLEAVGTAAELARVQGEISELRGELFGHEAQLIDVGPTPMSTSGSGISAMAVEGGAAADSGKASSPGGGSAWDMNVTDLWGYMTKGT